MTHKLDIEELAFKRNSINTQVSASVEKRKGIDEYIRNLTKQISSIDQQIAQLKKSHSIKKQTITDHALLRYLERIHGFDTEKVRESILTDKLKEYMKMYGKGKMTENGITYVFRDNAVVTIMFE